MARLLVEKTYHDTFKKKIKKEGGYHLTDERYFKRAQRKGTRDLRRAEIDLRDKELRERG